MIGAPHEVSVTVFHGGRRDGAGRRLVAFGQEMEPVPIDAPISGIAKLAPSGEQATSEAARGAHYAFPRSTGTYSHSLWNDVDKARQSDEPLRSGGYRPWIRLGRFIDPRCAFSPLP